MKRRSTSIAARVAWAAFASAALAAAIAAIASSVLADLLVLRQTDRHLVAVASELVRELGSTSDTRSIDSIVHDEQEEVTSTGIRLTVYGPGARQLAGDVNVSFVNDERCSTVQDLRICGVRATGEKLVVAGTLRERSYGVLAIAAMAAAVLAGGVAWFIARALSRHAVGPLVRLETRIANMSPEATGAATRQADLGDDEGVDEVDALRKALEMLLARMHDAIDRSTHFAANAAHELRTPLTALRAELELMIEARQRHDAGDVANGPSSSPQALGVALRKVAQLQSLTERLLVLATPHGGGQDGFEIVSLRDVVDDAIAALSPDDISRVMLPDEDTDVFVRGDSLALGMVVSNGLSNALKFGQRVRLDLYATNDIAVVAIEDDGPGVPEGERARMFEPFARGDGSSRVPGHGLGLALVAHVSERHRGRACLTAARHSAAGARLEIHIPFAGGEPPKRTTPSSEGAA